jgi:hypothetical protein
MRGGWKILALPDPAILSAAAEYPSPALKGTLFRSEGERTGLRTISTALSVRGQPAGLTAPECPNSRGRRVACPTFGLAWLRGPKREFVRACSLPNPSILSSPCIGVQNLSPTPVPPCLQWVTPFLHSWLRCGSRIPGCPALAQGMPRLNVCARPVSRDTRRAATDAEGCHHHSRAEADVPGGGGAPSGVRARECPSGPLCCWPRTHQSVLHLSSNLRLTLLRGLFHPLWGDKNCRVGNSRKS